MPAASRWPRPAARRSWSASSWRWQSRPGSFARAIPAAGPAAPGLAITANPWTSTLALLRELKSDRRLWGGAHIISWFWLVGFVVLSLLPALIKTLVGGSEGVVTLCLAVFTVGIAIGSGLAARASHGQPNLGLVPLGALLMGIFSLGIAWIAAILVPGAQPIGPWEMLASGPGLALLVCLCGLAVAGGLYIVPSFAAVQAWAPVDRRARVIAAVNVLNAAYMVGAGGIVAVLQAVGVGVPLLFAVLGVLSIAVVAYVVHAWGSEVMRDAGRTVFRFFFRLEVTGLENIPGPGQRVVIAPNHVSLLDGPLLHTILPKQAGFAVNNQIAQAWWVRPFLSVIKAHLLEPTKPLAARAIVNAVKAGETIVIFPEGRITLTGGLMKAYDGAGMIVDKADAWLVPVRIEGPERSPFGYLRSTQTEEVAVPQVQGDVPAPAPADRGSRSQGQGAAAGGRPGAAGHAGRHGRRDGALRSHAVCSIGRRSAHARHRPAGDQRSARHQAQLPQADPRRPGAGRQARAARAGGRRRRRHAAELGRRRRGVLRSPGHRPRPGHDQLHQRRRQHQGGLPAPPACGRSSPRAPSSTRDA